MLLLKVLKFVVNHPLNKHRKFKAVLKFIKWQMGYRLNPYPIIFPYAEKSKLILKRGLTGATGNFYCGLHEFADMSFTLHFLRNSDYFIDIGANVGSYTVLAGSEVGSNTISIEPIPNTFKILTDNIHLNSMQQNVKALNIGLGKEKGELNFTKSFDTMNHVTEIATKDSIKIPVEKFDDIIDIADTTLIKVDVEGFETEVLNGMNKALTNENLKAIIIELNGSGERYGYDDNLIHEKLVAHNFMPYQYFPFERKLEPKDSFGTHNTIYVRDLTFVIDRLKSAKKIKINGREF